MREGGAFSGRPQDDKALDTSVDGSVNWAEAPPYRASPSGVKGVTMHGVETFQSHRTSLR